MRLQVFIMLFFTVTTQAKPYFCQIAQFGNLPFKEIGSFEVDPNGGQAQQVLISEPEPGKVLCYGQQLTNSIRLVCSISSPAHAGFQPTASITDGGVLMTLNSPLGDRKNTYGIACSGTWTKLSPLVELIQMSEIK